MDSIDNFLPENGAHAKGLFQVGGVFDVECIGRDGKVKWREQAHNLITTEGLNHILDVVLHGSTPITTWYIGLKGTGSPAAGDIMSSHATWSEIVPYSQATRVEYNEAAASNGSTTNSANRAQFSINANTTIYGAFITSGSAKSGTSGTLLCASNFGTSRAVENGDTLNVTYTLTATSS